VDEFDQRVTTVALLGEPIRRALYRFVAAHAEPVSREQAAAGVGVPHHVAKFHLDKLEEDGLLDVEYRRPPGRSGPGAGRPAKLYRRSARPIAVNLPERRYELAGRVLAEAVSNAERRDIPVNRAVAEAARAAGQALGDVPVSSADSDPLEAVREALAANGYEPRLVDGRLILGNCPFHALAETHRDLVCGLNRDLVDGLLDTQPCDLKARLEPGPGRCCVTVGE